MQISVKLFNIKCFISVRSVLFCGPIVCMDMFLIYSTPSPRSHSLLNFKEIRKQYHVKTSFTHYETYKCTYLAYETTLSVILSLHLYIL